MDRGAGGAPRSLYAALEEASVRQNIVPSPASSGSSCVMAWREESSPEFRRPEAKAPGAGDGHDVSGCLH
jgi:hypothetical protein